MREGWKRVSKREPCPVCQRPDWCGITTDGAVSHCMRIPSDWECKKGGWFHRLKETMEARPFRWTAPPEPRRRQLDVRAIIDRWAKATTLQQTTDLAECLGVAVESILMLCAAWSARHDAWAFPMSDGAGNWIGIRMRNGDGDKWAIQDSRGGLFLPMNMIDDGPVFLVEGPTDTAAVLSLDLDAIGRPSCNSGDDLVATWCKAHPDRDVVIVANRDEEKRAGERTFYPGQEGAAALANKLLGVAKSIRVILPTEGKDARAWLAAGASRELVLTVAHDTAKWKRRKGAA